MVMVDFRLLDISLELYALKNHYKLIEKELLHLKKSEESALNEYRRKEKLTPEDPEWDIARHECERKVEFLIPRFFWGSFIITLYAVFETGVTEIALLLQKSQGQEKGIEDIKGSFLESANKYYKNILKFELCNDNKTWQRIKMLAELRNTMAHRNGRLDMLKETSRKKIREWEKQKIGISTTLDYLLIDSEFAKETFTIINFSLESLVERYKDYDTKSKPV